MDLKQEIERIYKEAIFRIKELKKEKIL